MTRVQSVYIRTYELANLYKLKGCIYELVLVTYVQLGGHPCTYPGVVSRASETTPVRTMGCTSTYTSIMLYGACTYP